MMRLILPKTYLPLDNLSEPVFFLAGPIRGGNDWQAKCFELLEQQAGTVVIPCRYQPDHPLYRRSCYGQVSPFRRQVEWERYYLEIASSSGCIIFWLAVQEPSFVPEPGHSYARDTRGELGEWRGRMIISQELGLLLPKLVIGAESGFPGLDVIKANFNYGLQLDFPIHSTLDETIKAAITVATKSETE